MSRARNFGSAKNPTSTKTSSTLVEANSAMAKPSSANEDSIESTAYPNLANQPGSNGGSLAQFRAGVGTSGTHMSGDDPHPVSKWLLRLRRFRCRSYFGVVFRLVDMLRNERDHVGWTIDTGESRVEDWLGQAGCGL